MAKDYPKNYKWMLLALLSAMYFLAQGSRQIFNAVLPQIKADFACVGLLVLAYGVLNAAGQALLPPSNSSLIGQFHVETRATAFSIYQIVFYIGIVVCSCVSGWLSGLGAGGWRKAFFLFGAISAAWAFALAFLLRDTPQVRGTGNGESSSDKATEDKRG